MTELRLFLALAALLCMALFYVRLGVKSALAPLCAVGTVALGLSLFGALGLSLFGALGLLRLGGWLLYGFAAFCAGFLIWQGIAKKKWPPAPGFGFWFFAAGSLFFIFLLWAKQPLFTNWDEFSLWGVSSKLMKLTDQLYTTAPAGWTWVSTQKPAYLAFPYFFQFFGSQYAEWQVYAACNIFQLAMMATLFAPFEGKLRQNWTSAVPVALFALLVPYVFQHYQTAQSVSPAYLDAYVDIALGLCFGAVLACGLCAGNTKTAASLVPTGIALAMLTLMKDTGFALALVAAVIIAVDWFIKTPKGTRKKGFALRLAGGLGVVVLLFAAWEVYAGSLSGSSRLDSAVTTGGVGMLEMPFAFVRDALNPAGMTEAKRAVFNHVISGMTQFFFSAPGNALGTGLVVSLLALGFLALAAFLYKDKTHRKRVGAFAILSTLGFAAWYWLLAMTYIYIFRESQAYEFESYDRYVYPYYIGWLLGALVLLCVALAHSKSRLLPAARAVVLGFSAVVLVKVALLVPMPYTVLGVNTQEYNQRREFNQKADDLKQYLDPGGRTFLVMSGDNGMGWFMYHHQMLPWRMDYSYGGTMVVREAQPDGTTLKIEVTPEMLAEHLIETGCTTLYIDYADYEFIEAYGELFSDGLTAYQNDKANLYTVQVQGDEVTLDPLYWQSLE